jgi:hypothetical protein
MCDFTAHTSSTDPIPSRRLVEAQRLIARMHTRDPALRISNLSDLIPFSREQDFAKWTDGLRKAGLPD